ncbi:MAG: hypothetical protein M1368_09545, partial [Thaumarchaeota archaeon]|nr:hypothetical protein [Nitrososphaerota archaeon]
DLLLARAVSQRSSFRAGALTLLHEAVIAHAYLQNTLPYITYTRFSFMEVADARYDRAGELRVSRDNVNHVVPVIRQNAGAAYVLNHYQFGSKPSFRIILP